MSAFHDVRFPLSIGLSARGGPERRTEIVPLVSGREERNAVWAGSRRRWDAAPGVRSLDDVAALLAFFEARRGRLHAFRFADPLDHKSCAPSVDPASSDQALGTGDGVRTQFQLIKTYGSGASAWTRAITHPLEDSILVSVDGVATAFTLQDGGAIVLDAPAPIGASVTAGYRFDTPARFDTDRLEITAEGFRAGDLGAVPLIEVRV